MNKSPRLFLSAALLLAAFGSISTQGQQIYTWTDDDGVVHFVDTPPDNPRAVAVDAPELYRPGSADAYPQARPIDTPDSAGGAEAQSTSPEDSAAGELSYADQKREKLAREREERRRAQDEQGRKCADARRQLETLEPSRRVYFTNAQGETERMDDEERVRLVEEAKAIVARDCQ